IGWPLPKGLSEEELESKLFGSQPVVVLAAATAGLEVDSRATAATSPSDPAVCVGRISASPPGGISLQLVLRALSALAAALGCGAAAGTQGRGEDVRGLGGRDDSRL